MPAGASERFVLDSYALLAYFQDEEGADKVQTVLEMGSEGKAHLFLSVVNLGEVLYVVERERGVSRAHEILARIEEMPIEIVDVSRRVRNKDAGHHFATPIYVKVATRTSRRDASL